MVNWVIIIVLIVFGIFAIKMNHLRHRVFIIILLLIALFFYLSLNVVSTKNQLDFSSTEGIFNSLKIYTGWMAHGFQNIKTITGNAVKMDWSSTNSSFLKNDKQTSQSNSKPGLASVKIINKK